MAKHQNSEIIVSLDIGSTKVLAIVAEKTTDGIHILGYGKKDSDGVKKGIIVNIDKVVIAIKSAIRDAELMAGCEINTVYAGISGDHVDSLTSGGRISILNGEIDKDDVTRVIQSAEAISIPANRDVIHVLVQSFVIDGKTEVDNPIGMHGDILEAKVHIVTGEISTIKNIAKSIAQCGLEIVSTILEPLAVSYTVLNNDEKDLGVCVVDIGGGTTDIAIYVNGSLQHTAVFPIAGISVTNDIMYAFNASQENAEKLKKKHGFALAELIKEEKFIEVEHMSDSEMHKLSNRTLAEVIEPRYEEIFTQIKNNLQLEGYENLIPSGFVLSGGGSKIKGCTHLAESIFNKPVRLGNNDGVKGLDNMKSNTTFSTAIGLILFSQDKKMHSYNFQKRIFSFSGRGFFGNIKRWLSHF